MKEQGFTEDELFDDDSGLADVSQKAQRLNAKLKQQDRVRKLKKAMSDIDKRLTKQAAEEKKSGLWDDRKTVIHGRDPKNKPTPSSSSSSGFRVGGTTGSKEMSAIQSKFMQNMQAAMEGKLKVGAAAVARTTAKADDTIEKIAQSSVRRESDMLKRFRAQTKAITSILRSGGEKVGNLGQTIRTAGEVGSVGVEVLREELAAKLRMFSKKVGGSVGDSLDDALDDKGFKREMQEEVEKGLKKQGGGVAGMLLGLFGKNKGGSSTAYDRALQRNALKGLNVGGGKGKDKEEKGVVDTIVDKAKAVVGGVSGTAVATTAAVAGAGAVAYANKDAIVSAGKRALGWLSEKYESGGRGVATISSGRGDAGGVSYGKYQIASKTGTMAKFLKSKHGAPYRAEFAGATPGSAKFNQIYKRIVAREGDKFNQAQHAFIEETHHTPLYKHAKKLGFDVDNPVMANVIWSFGVQHGGAAKIFSAVAASGVNLRDNKATIKALYAERGRYIKKNKVGGADGIIKGRYAKEQSDALAALSSGAAVAAPGAVSTAPKETPVSGQSTRQRALEALERNTKKHGDVPGAGIGASMTEWAIRHSDTAANLYASLNASDAKAAQGISREATGRAPVVPPSQRKRTGIDGYAATAPVLRETSKYGMRNHPTKGGRKMHHGQDYAMKVGTPIYAVRAGKVHQAGNDPKGGGLFIRIEHAGKYFSAYLHLSKIMVQKGQQVREGQQIGLSGNTGSSTGPHLHYQVDRGTTSTSVDPSTLPYTGIAEGSAAGAAAALGSAVQKGAVPSTGGNMGATVSPAPITGGVTTQKSFDAEMASVLVGGTDPYGRILDEFRADNYRRAQATQQQQASQAPAAGQAAGGGGDGGGADQKMYLAIEDQALASLLMQGITAR